MLCGPPSIVTSRTSSSSAGSRAAVAWNGRIDVPVLVVHGAEDRILPYQATAARLPALLDDIELVTIEGGPHNIAWTHADEVNTALLEFIAAPVAA